MGREGQRESWGGVLCTCVSECWQGGEDPSPHLYPQAEAVSTVNWGLGHQGADLPG